MKRLILIDAHALIHRAFHALPPLSAPDGAPTNAAYGFTSVLLKILRELKPGYLVAAFDHEGETFRHLAFESYKAHREKAPDVLYQQIPLVKEILSTFGVPVVEKQGFEADDLIGTIASNVRRKHKNIEVLIVTGDLDTLQLVEEGVKVFALKKGVTETFLYDVTAVKERYGLEPKRLIDFKGLRGDPSDNIPGVKGIGEKTASELLQSYGSVEDIYQALKKGKLQAKPSVVAALRDSEADALFSKSLATIDCHVPIDFVLSAARIRKPEMTQVRLLFERLGFYSLLRRLDGERVLTHRQSENRAQPDLAVGGTKVEVLAAKTLAGIAMEDYGVLVKDPDGKGLLLAVNKKRVFKLPLITGTFDGLKSWLGPRKLFVFDLKSLLACGFPPEAGEVLDLKIAWWLLEPSRKNYSAAALAAKETGESLTGRSEEVAAILFGLGPLVIKRLKDEELFSLYAELESPLVPVLYDMERRGIRVETGPLIRLSKKMAGELTSLEKKIHAAVGAAFNINSPRQLGEALFERLGLAAKGMRRTEKLGTMSTRESELLKLKSLHPVISDILSYREITKLKSTYVDALPDLISGDGRIHTTWNQTGTATGRLSSQNPNLQNIPAKSRYSREIRKAFVAEEGFELVAFDYSQLELRIAADLSGDEKMIEAFSRGDDIHTLTASAVSGVPLEKVTPELRRKAKTLNFGILYGMGSQALAESGGMSRDEARVFIEEYFKNFRRLAQFIAAIKDFAHVHGFTKTAFGRKRFYPELGASSFRLQREAERMAVNHPIQGTAADIVKKAMIEVEEFLKRRQLKGKIRFLLQIHDELIMEAQKEISREIIAAMGEIMVRVWSGKVAMKVEIHHGRNWAELE